MAGFNQNQKEYEAVFARTKRQGGDARIRINPNRAFEAAIHLPREGSYPLYPHGKNSRITGEKESVPSWLKASESTYNSPTNVRAIYFELKKAAVGYWVKPWVNRGEAPLKYLQSEYIGSDGVAFWINPYKYLFQSCGLHSLVGQLSLPNLEEVWLTAELYANADPECMQFYHKLMGLKPGQVEFDEFPKKIFEKETQGWVRDLFPMLRSIVVVVTPFQFACWHGNQNIQIESSFYTLHTAEVDDFLRKQFPTKRCTITDSPDLLSKCAENKGFAFVVSHIPTSDVSKFTTGDYRFDELRLEQVKGAVKAKYGVEVTKARIEKEVEDAASMDNVRSLFKDEEEHDYEILTRQVFGGVSKLLEDEDYDCGEFQIGLLKNEKWACKFDCTKDELSVNVGIWDNLDKYQLKTGQNVKVYTCPATVDELVQAVYQGVCDILGSSE